MIRCVIKVATLAALFQTAEAHVRAIPTGMGCRTCNGKAAPGPFSTSGPLGGNAAFGKNGLNVVNEGQEVSISIGYNGGHQSATLNYFNVRYVCGTQAAANQNNFKKVGSSDKNTINCKAPCKQLTAAQIKTVGGQAATAQNYPIDATQSSRDGYKVTFQIPKIEGTGDQRKCTFAMVEGRDWGAGWDFDIQAANANPGGGAIPAPVTQAPAPIKSLSGTYLFSSANCVKDAPNCACLTGAILVNHVAGAKTASARVAIPNYPPKIIQLSEKPGIPGALSTQYILSNCASQKDQLMDLNLSPLGTTQGSLNVGILDNFPTVCGALVKTTTAPTTITPAAPILKCAGCSDVANWKDTDGDTCAQYASCSNGDWRTKDIKHYQQFKNTLGQTALDACCVCGGGQYALDGNPTTKPSPAGCLLTIWGGAKGACDAGNGVYDVTSNGHLGGPEKITCGKEVTGWATNHLPRLGFANVAASFLATGTKTGRNIAETGMFATFKNPATGCADTAVVVTGGNNPVVTGGNNPVVTGGNNPGQTTAPGGTTRTNSLFGPKASDPAQAVGVAAGAVLAVVAAMSM